MHSTYAIILAAIASCLPSSTASADPLITAGHRLPKCVNECYSGIIEKSPCSMDDITCYCSNKHLIERSVGCMEANCSWDDMAYGIAHGKKICAGLGLPFTLVNTESKTIVEKRSTLRSPLRKPHRPIFERADQQDPPEVKPLPSIDEDIAKPLDAANAGIIRANYMLSPISKVDQEHVPVIGRPTKNRQPVADKTVLANPHEVEDEENGARIAGAHWLVIPAVAMLAIVQ